MNFNFHLQSLDMARDLKFRVKPHISQGKVINSFFLKLLFCTDMSYPSVKYFSSLNSNDDSS